MSFVVRRFRRGELQFQIQRPEGPQVDTQSSKRTTRSSSFYLFRPEWQPFPRRWHWQTRSYAECKETCCVPLNDLSRYRAVRPLNSGVHSLSLATLRLNGTAYSAPEWHMKIFIDAIAKTFVDAITSDPFTMGTHVTAGVPAGQRRSPLRLTKP